MSSNAGVIAFIAENQALKANIESLSLENARLSDFLCFVKSRYPEVYPAYQTALKELAKELALKQHEYRETEK